MEGCYLANMIIRIRGDIIIGLLTTALLLSVLVTTEEAAYAQTTTTPTQDDIDGDGMPNKSDVNDDNDDKADFLDDDDDNDNSPDSVDPILNTPEQRGAPPPPPTTNNTSTTTTTTTPPPAATTPAQDPDFARFVEIAGQCGTSSMLGTSGGMTQDECTQFIDDGQNRWCGLIDYDVDKCSHATNINNAWKNLLNVSKQYGFDEIPSLGELGIDPRPFAPSP